MPEDFRKGQVILWVRFEPRECHDVPEEMWGHAPASMTQSKVRNSYGHLCERKWFSSLIDEKRSWVSTVKQVWPKLLEVLLKESDQRSRQYTIYLNPCSGPRLGLLAFKSELPEFGLRVLLFFQLDPFRLVNVQKRWDFPFEQIGFQIG